MTETGDLSNRGTDARLTASSIADQAVIDEVYRRRARRLADRQVGATVATTWAVLVFGLGKERYAIELSELAEVIAFRDCTPVPGVSPALIGVINVRGEITAVADLSRLLELQPGDGSAAGYVLILRQQGQAIGLKVDRVDHVRQIDPAQVVSARDGAAPIAGSRFVRALTADTVMVIDTRAALAQLGHPAE